VAGGFPHRSQGVHRPPEEPPTSAAATAARMTARARPQLAAPACWLRTYRPAEARHPLRAWGEHGYFVIARLYRRRH